MFWWFCLNETVGSEAYAHFESKLCRAQKPLVKIQSAQVVKIQSAPTIPALFLRTAVPWMQ
jgi:hypothetical protein